MAFSWEVSGLGEGPSSLVPGAKPHCMSPPALPVKGRQHSTVGVGTAPWPSSSGGASQNPAAGSLQVALRGFSFQKDLNTGRRVSDIENAVKHKNLVL